MKTAAQYNVVGKEYLTENQLATFLHRIDNRFTIPISSRQPSLEEYARKVMTFGEIVAVVVESQIVGAILFYCNDMENRVGYLALLAVEEEYENKGIGNCLVEESCRKCKRAEMRCIGLYSDNPKAIAIYQKHGFEIMNCENQDNRLYLKKQL